MRSSSSQQVPVNSTYFQLEFTFKLNIEPLASLYARISETPTRLIAFLNLQHRQDYANLEKVDQLEIQLENST